jgi:sphinganine-1-phosphate aldolase
LIKGRASFPDGGRTWDDLKEAMIGKSRDDIDWQRGRAPNFVFFNNQETYEIGRRAYFQFFTENALGGSRAFLGIGEMEKQVLDYGLDLFLAPQGADGAFTNGGSESIFLAVKAARDFHRSTRSTTSARLNLVMPDTAHAAFDKAAAVMDLDIRRAPLTADKRVDVEAMSKLIDGNTMLLVGSAPCYPHGVVDPIGAISELAVSSNIWLHVDACVGGWIAPFFQRIGRPTPYFDFRFAGVRSISADLHKFGFCPKPASTVFYRNAADKERALFVADAWPGGVYRTATLAGTRPAGGVAAAWAVLNHLGSAGYERAAMELATMVDAYVADITAIEGLEFWAQPDLSIINFGSSTYDINAVAEGMASRGWLPGLTRRPKGLHLMMSLFHAPVREEYVNDLRQAVAKVQQGAAGPAKILATY